jgi:hypothetical protein
LLVVIFVKELLEALNYTLTVFFGKLLLNPSLLEVRVQDHRRPVSRRVLESKDANHSTQLNMLK